MDFAGPVLLQNFHMYFSSVTFMSVKTILRIFFVHLYHYVVSKNLRNYACRCYSNAFLVSVYYVFLIIFSYIGNLKSISEYKLGFYTYILNNLKKKPFELMRKFQFYLSPPAQISLFERK